MAEEISDADFKKFHRLVQDIALTAYPNPDRIGCLGQAALEEVASLPLSSRHALFQTHINRCSECLRDLLEIRRRNNMRGQRRKRWILTACDTVLHGPDAIAYLAFCWTFSSSIKGCGKCATS